MGRPAISHLILYGSLRRGQPSFHELRLDTRLRFMRMVRFAGALYDLGDYPGLLLEPARGEVVGELHLVRDASVMADLDEFEIARPDEPQPYDPRTGRGSLYRRRTLRVGDVEADIYVFNAALPPAAPVIVSGDWLKRRG